MKYPGVECSKSIVLRERYIQRMINGEMIHFVSHTTYQCWPTKPFGHLLHQSILSISETFLSFLTLNHSFHNYFFHCYSLLPKSNVDGQGEGPVPIVSPTNGKDPVSFCPTLKSLLKIINLRPELMNMTIGLSTTFYGRKYSTTIR